MQQAYAAYAAAETAPAAEAHSEPNFAPESPTSTETAVPEAVQTLSSVADEASEVMSAAVKRFETWLSSYVPESAPPATDSSPWSSGGASPAADVAAFEARRQPLEVPASQEASVSAETAHATSSEAVPQFQQIKSSPQKNRCTHPPRNWRMKCPLLQQSRSGLSEVEVSPESTSPALVATKDLDMAATTAAAWASWRRSREGERPVLLRIRDLQRTHRFSHHRRCHGSGGGADRARKMWRARSSPILPSPVSSTASLLAYVRRSSKKFSQARKK